MTNATVKKNSAESAISAYTRGGNYRSPPYPYIFLSHLPFHALFLFCLCLCLGLFLYPAVVLSRLGTL